jgi:gluconokinase
MSFQSPVSDYVETSGIVFFARMLDKIRLHAASRLAPGYLRGTEDPTCFDARFCAFWEVEYDALERRTLEGGTDEEVLAWCFRDRKFPNETQVLVWNSFLLKRGWRDSGSSGVVAEKARHGWAGRDDIQTYVDLHDMDEGRQPKFPMS